MTNEIKNKEQVSFDNDVDMTAVLSHMVGSTITCPMCETQFSAEEGTCPQCDYIVMAKDNAIDISEIPAPTPKIKPKSFRK